LQVALESTLIELIADEIVLSYDNGKAKKWYAFIKAITPHENKFKKAMKGYFIEQEKVVLANMKRTPKSMVRKDIIDHWLFPKKHWDTELVVMSTPLVKETVVEIGQGELTQLISGISFDLQDPMVVDFMEKHIPKFSFEVNKTTANALRKTLRAGIEAGEGIPDLKKRVNGVFHFADNYRAERIARTETARAANRATEFAYMQSGEVEGKEWVTALDERTCPWCEDMNGKTMGLGENYFDEGDSLTVTGDKGKPQIIHFDYEEIIDPPLHANCRCTLVPILKTI